MILWILLNQFDKVGVKQELSGHIRYRSELGNNNCLAKASLFSENLKDTSELGNGTCLANVSLMINTVG